MYPFLSQAFQTLSLGGIVLAVFIILLLNSKKVNKSRANKMLSLLVFALAFSNAHIFFAGDALSHFSHNIYTIGDPTFFLVAPLLWLYVRELTGEQAKWQWRLGLQFAPFLLIVLLSLSLRSVNSATFQSFLAQNHRLITILYWIVLVFQFSWVHVLVTKRWNYHQRIIPQEVSNLENVSITWVRLFMVVFLIINFIFLISLASVVHSLDGDWLQLMTATIFSLAIFALGYKGILQIEVFNKGDVVAKENNTNTLPPAENPKSSQIDLSRLKQLNIFMEEKKPYLNAELTLTDLASELEIPRGQLSQLINEGTGDNFYDFVNKYRVEEVKKLMIDPSMKNFNMLGIALEAGFKSKSTFNLIFKRFTGLTPSEYRKNISLK
ncbi:MAG TPA: helix-turn-helix domain-containing protein [Cyclobacteriaceae bacterium]|nr:helix-turn-helix domain-containing protein [Bacteroidetes bacterium CHB5]HNT49435.1 helix-turn-helix domain-containing protein [Cyclobacteriaceae bacterium]